MMSVVRMFPNLMTGLRIWVNAEVDGEGPPPEPRFRLLDRTRENKSSLSSVSALIVDPYLILCPPLIGNRHT